MSGREPELVGLAVVFDEPSVIAGPHPFDEVPGDHPLDVEFGLGFDSPLPCPVHRYEEHHELYKRRWDVYLADPADRNAEPRSGRLVCTCDDPEPCRDPTHETERSMGRTPRPQCVVCQRPHSGTTEDERCQ